MGSVPEEELPRREADDMADSTPTEDRIKTDLKAGEAKVVTSTLSIVNQESCAVADAGSDELIQRQDAAIDPEMWAKLAQLVKAKAAQNAASRALEDLDQQFKRGEADQQRAGPTCNPSVVATPRHDLRGC
jgi:hypothetical protein